MQITFDTTTLTPGDRALILAAIGVENTTPAATETSEATSTPAKRTRKAAAPKPAPEPEPEDEGTDGPTLEDAVARAQELVGKKLTDAVRAAVKELGAPRVSELKGDQIAQFLELVADADAEDESDPV